MKKITLLPLITATIFACFNSTYAHAENDRENNQSHGFDSFFAVSAIAGVSETNLIGDSFERIDDTDIFLEFDIELQARWNGFFVESPGRSQENINGLFSGVAVGYNFYNTEHWALDLYVVEAFQGGEYFFNSNTDSLIIEKDSNSRVGARATGYFSDYLIQFIASPISLQDEIKGFSASASLRRTWQIKNWNVYATVGAFYQSDEIADYYYGISESESAQIKQLFNDNNAPYDPYTADGGVLIVGEVGFEYPVSENIVFGGFFSGVQRPSGISDSPLSAEGSSILTAGLSLTYVF
ncbi:MipA/OmpV family protein [Glaciecola petra]|uniref:MipA/OmpV family protein n=1 Tax=Glaciecola petra TaxID=3075602 RepID=A0ABU2ZUG3_9ALTE|nr:MipA/OmpV family protein [Aestuariibacter sp. P117]MDT0596045.1 MipA/OmpV family protein [Aestuariibacter sp. P117]